MRAGPSQERSAGLRGDSGQTPEQLDIFEAAFERIVPHQHRPRDIAGGFENELTGARQAKLLLRQEIIDQLLF